MNGTNTIRWLFDLEVGGSPAAFKCLIEDCGSVTRTLVGMRTHQRIVHAVKEQEELFDDKQMSIADST